LRRLHTASAPTGYALGWATRGPHAAPTRIGHSGSLLTFSAEQVVLPERRVGVALLFNSSSGYMFEQQAILDGVLRLLDGKTPGSPTIPTGAVDPVLAVLTLAVLGLGAAGVLRARRWVSRHRAAPLAAATRLLPQLGVLGAAAAFPTIAVWMMDGRDVTWRIAAYGWPALVVLVLAAALAALATVASRIWHLAVATRAAATEARTVGAPAGEPRTRAARGTGRRSLPAPDAGGHHGAVITQDLNVRTGTR
jgi:hypothetical protein